MKRTHWFLGVLVLGALALALFTPFAANASHAISSLFAIAAEVEQETAPAMAYNSQRQEYLVVWYNDRPGNDDIRARRVAKDGRLLGGPFFVAAMNAERRYPDVAYNSAHDQYLVVWEHYEAANGYSIKARRVSGGGEVLDANDIVIRDPGYNLYTPVKPAVAYASTTDSYLVVWAETWHPLPISHEIIGRVILPSGTPDGNQFTIAQNSKALEEPDVAYNRHANRYLVVWQQLAGSLWDIHGQQVHGGGGLFQGDITIAYFTKSSTAPAVAAIPTSPGDDKFLVVWETLYVPPNDHDIYGRLVREDGTLGVDFWISWDNGIDETSPAVTGSEGNRQYFVSWRHPLGAVDKPVRGRAVSHDGSLIGPVANFPGVNADHPALASGPVGDVLVACQDQPVAATNTNIYGQLWGNRVYLPVTRRSP